MDTYHQLKFPIESLNFNLWIVQDIHCEYGNTLQCWKCAITEKYQHAKITRRIFLAF